MSERPFRFGVVAGHVPDVGAVTQLARRAEELGYDTLVTPDPVSGHDPMTLFAAVASATTRLHFGPFVLAESFRDHRMLSWQAQTLHALSGGRFELGLGTGRPGSDRQAAALGREFGSGGQRVERLADLIAEIRKNEDGPRLLLAAAGPKMLDLAAREADIVTFTGPPQTTEAEAGTVVQRFRDLAGDRADRIEVNVNLLAVGEDLSTEVNRFIGVSPAGLAEAGAATVVAGTPAQCIDTVQRRRAQWGISYVTVSSAYVEQFAPVVAALRGT